ncbi:hypothetical protein L208DRAFT_1382727 [Tricholoma matsutake]|nr:hypothetical protein L208DRAFT_1382727 [Tricholoma matsutake 945]
MEGLVRIEAAEVQAARKKLMTLLDNVSPDKLSSLDWQAQWSPIHGLGTAENGFKLATMNGSDGCYQVAAFKVLNRRIVMDAESPWITASWKNEPSGVEVIQGLMNPLIMACRRVSDSSTERKSNWSL